MAKSQRQLYVKFVDFQKAFNRDSLWKTLRRYGISQKNIHLNKSFYQTYSWPLLANEKHDENTDLFFLDHLDFADYLALLSHTHGHTQEKTDRLCMFDGQIWATCHPEENRDHVAKRYKAHISTAPTYNTQFTYFNSITDRMEALMKISRAELIRPEMSWKPWRISGNQLNTAPTQNWNYTKAVCFQPSCIVLNAGG